VLGRPTLGGDGNRKQIGSTDTQIGLYLAVSLFDMAEIIYLLKLEQTIIIIASCTLK